MKKQPRQHDYSPGTRFGRLTVIRELEHVNRRIRLLCKCDCGNEFITMAQSLIARPYATVSCGCRKIEWLLEHPRITHNKSNSGLYHVWSGMIARCCDVGNKRYKDYGGRGITVCERWMNIENFCEDMGARPLGKSLDRIDNCRGYYPENCKWSTRSEQQRNRRTNHLITWNEKTQCVGAWAEEIGTTFTNLNTRLMRGWSVERALTEPIHHKTA